MSYTFSVALRVVASPLLVAVLGVSAFAQGIRMTAPVNVANSGAVTTPAQAVPFASGVVNLTCASAPSSVKLSGTADGSGKIFSDNFIAVTVNGVRTPNVCTSGSADSGSNNCFTDLWHSNAGKPTSLGKNPDTSSGTSADTSFINDYGVPALNLTPIFVNASGAVEVKVEAMDWGGFLGSSSMYLVVTGCNTGKVIDPNNAGSLQQNFVFNNKADQQVEFDADWRKAPSTGIVSNTVPTVVDHGIDPSIWPTYVNNTSFANTTCVPHAGEKDASGKALCKLYTLTCTNASSSTPEGDNCPQSGARNLFFLDKFDADPTGVAQISGLILGKGIGFLMGSDAWAPGSCKLVGPELNFLCPQNTLTSFSDLSSGGTSRTTNSSFIVVTGVPLPTTTVTSVTPTPVGPTPATAWVNSSNVTLNFTSAPAVDAATNGFTQAGISSLTAGISLANNVPDTTFPVPGDTTRSNSTVLPSGATIGCPPGNLVPAAFNSSVAFTGLSDGQYLVHYFATDCAATEELLFDVSNLGNTNNWVSFKTYPINVDTVPPTASITTPANNASYAQGQNVLANYDCNDPAPGSGVPADKCVGTIANGAAIDTTTLGQKTFTVNATDLARNTGTASVSYTVVGPADLALRKHAPSYVKTGSNITYFMGLINRGPNTANSIVVTDPLPLNTTFVSAIWRQVTCSLSGDDFNCAVTSGTSCSLNQSNAAVCNIPSLPKFTFANPVGVGIRLVLKVGGPVGTYLKNTATVNAANADSNLSNNTSSVTTKVTQ